MSVAGKETTIETAEAGGLEISRLAVNDDVERIEAPVTWKAYLICAFASFGGIFFGYDSGYINGATSSSVFIRQVEGPDWTGSSLSDSNLALITCILSLGTFIGALVSGDVADMIGRKWTVIAGCGIYTVGVVIQMITGEGNALACIVVGRVVAGIGVGFESAVVILYMSEIVSSLYLSSFLDCRYGN
jgi:MFS family permease